jgi:protein tyrosine/serine phosphatase
MQDRVLALEGVVNFRDMGGYRGAGGVLARGRLFRSAHFAEATPRDLERLDGLGAALVVDLRRREERELEPNRWPGAGVEVAANDIDLNGLPPHLAALMQAEITAAGVRSYMQTSYATYPWEARYQDLFRRWFHGVLAAEGAAVVHCAAGKDRTGMAVAMLQLALGVSMDDVEADYLLTNEAIDLEARAVRLKPRIEERAGKPVPDDALKPMLGVEISYLRSGLGAIAERHGTVSKYLADELGFGPDKQMRLHEKLIV